MWRSTSNNSPCPPRRSPSRAAASAWAATSASKQAIRNAPLPHAGSSTRTDLSSPSHPSQKSTRAPRRAAVRAAGSNSRGSFSTPFACVLPAAAYFAARSRSNRPRNASPSARSVTYSVTNSGV